MTACCECTMKGYASFSLELELEEGVDRASAGIDDADSRGKVASVIGAKT